MFLLCHTVNTPLILLLSLPFLYPIKHNLLPYFNIYFYSYIYQISSHNLCTVTLDYSRDYVFFFQISVIAVTGTQSIWNAVHTLSFPDIRVLAFYLLLDINSIFNPIFTNIFIIKLFPPSKFLVRLKQNINFQFIFLVTVFC